MLGTRMLPPIDASAPETSKERKEQIPAYDAAFVRLVKHVRLGGFSLALAATLSSKCWRSGSRLTHR